MNTIDQVVVFQAGQEEYAISVKEVISIEKIQNVTPIPHLPTYVRGITKVRDELIPVIDFDTILYSSQAENLQDYKMIVLQTGLLPIGIIVQDAKEILNVPEGALKQVGLLAYSKTKYFTSVINLDDRLVTVVDPSILVESLEGVHEILEFINKEKQEEVS
ncbi:chemotaxis protein CheW [Bacillus coahuilensis m2-6]|uniref:Chemotaxis protein CheW n=1 Tax=Bacillus coahuilensis p1.1.43 TaxID=1150625 RepID=A0A147K7V5_9BACI|nr:chemotaxis protein CheW [Bacillus coahuilensis]KUP06137.1 chemotaxis protein CheW [Bacillus coahuilensis p1.1.43]KUP07482.1 chemotaxis protein CheW [Bacillus coahuilensis m2-6]